MNLKRRFNRPAAPAPKTIEPAPQTAADWTLWLRLIERKRRLLTRLSPRGGHLPRTLLARLTAVSFRLDGLEVSDEQVADAISKTRRRKPFRSRLGQRLRNHLAILRGIERMVRRAQPLKVASVLRWYTSVSWGLCNSSLDEGSMDRLETVVRRMSSPRLQLQPAIRDVAQLHVQLMVDPVVPSFNGILARLLLSYHLGRCGLPPVVFDPTVDRPLLAQAPSLLTRLMDLVDASYSLMLMGT
jgi:hypothetical protein